MPERAGDGGRGEHRGVRAGEPFRHDASGWTVDGGHNFGRWISDNREASILIQHTELPAGDIRDCDMPVLGRVTWATSDDDTKMVPGRTEFQTLHLPATPQQLLRWLNGESLRSISERN